MTETDREEILFHDILACCRALEEKKADELLILDLRGISTITDYFINRQRQVGAAFEGLTNRPRKDSQGEGY